jgi:hypothetical protein
MSQSGLSPDDSIAFAGALVDFARNPFALRDTQECVVLEDWIENKKKI